MEYKYLVFEGASSKIYCYLGVLDVLKDNNILKNITHYIGTSSGSIIASMLALGYQPSEIKELIYSVEPEKLGIFPNIIKGAYNLINKYGYLNSSPYTKWLKNMIKVKYNKEDLTFKELYDSSGKILIITGTCINKRETHFYNYISNPDMPIHKAIQISTALPFILPAIEWNSDLLVDGGILENYPVYYVNEDGSFPNSKEQIITYNSKKHTGNKYTLGIKILPENYEETNKLFNGNMETKNIKDYTLNILNTMLTQIEKNGIKENYWENTITIKINKNIENYNVSLTKEQKDLLYNDGKFYTSLFLSKK